MQRYSSYANARVEGLVLAKDSTAVAGSYLVMEKEGSISWEISVPDSGYYHIEFRYRAFGGSKAQFLVKNGHRIPVGFSMAEDWAMFSQPFFLEKGRNWVGLEADWGHMDIDLLQISACSPEVRISPLKQTVYTAHPRSLRYKLDNFKEAVKEVRIDGRPVAHQILDNPHQERAVWLKLSAEVLEKLSAGNHVLEVELETGKVESILRMEEKVKEHGLTILAPDSEHGAAVLIRLPTGRNLLIDTGKRWVRDSILIPMFHRNGIDTIHTLVLTHYHGDHDSGDRGETIIREFHTEKVIDYQSHRTGDVLESDSVFIRILNSYEVGMDENTRSLAFTLSYRDFVYNHGGDTYHINQQSMLDKFGEANKAQVFFANHHFHGSVMPTYIRYVNPDLVLLQAQEAVYARSAYMVDYLEESIIPLDRERDEAVETLFALELGASVISVVDGENWWYSTYWEQDAALFPEFGQR